MEHAIITGATGTVGLALVEELLRSGKLVTAVVRPGSERADRLPVNDRLSVVSHPLERVSELPERLGPSEGRCVFYDLAWDHSRAHNDMEKQLPNVAYTLDAIGVAARLGCECFVGAGSQAEYGLVDGPIDEDTLPRPETAYGAAKLAAGQLGRVRCEQLGLRFVWPRIFSVYGPGDRDETVVMGTIRKLLAGERPALTAGEQLWDFLYSSDAAAALRLLGDTDKCAGIYCVGNGEPRTLRAYLEELRDVVAPGAPLGFGECPYGEKQVMNLHPCIDRLRADTGFRPFVAFADGIRRTADWRRGRPVPAGNGYRPQ